MSETWRHKKRGTEYQLLGIGKMQSENWYEDNIGWDNIDMREVAVYQGSDAQIWVRPIEEFKDGRFEQVANFPPKPQTHIK